MHNTEWDASEADAGTTLLELFAFLAENAIYRANLIPERIPHWINGEERGETPFSERFSPGEYVLVMRRELKRDGRGRVLINGLISSLSIFERLGPRLLSIQSQDQQRILSHTAYARQFLDRALQLNAELIRMAASVAAFKALRRQLAERTSEQEFADHGEEVIRLMSTLYAVPFYQAVGYRESTGVRRMRSFDGDGLEYQPMKKVLKRR